jgi:hypothetical protein
VCMVCVYGVCVCMCVCMCVCVCVCVCVCGVWCMGGLIGKYGIKGCKRLGLIGRVVIKGWV